MITITFITAWFLLLKSFIIYSKEIRTRILFAFEIIKIKNSFKVIIIEPEELNYIYDYKNNIFNNLWINRIIIILIRNTQFVLYKIYFLIYQLYINYISIPYISIMRYMNMKYHQSISLCIFKYKEESKENNG